MAKLATWWVVTEKFTVRVRIDEREVIRDAAPLVRKFKGQDVRNLVQWAKKFRLVAVHRGLDW